MEYVIMTMEEAKKVVNDDTIVLVSVLDLEKKDFNADFKRKKFCECHNILQESKTIARIPGDFMDQLRIFSEKQIDIIDYMPVGKLSTVLFR